MKKLKNIEELESLLKEQLGKAEIPAPPDVWSGVSAAAGNSANIFSQLSTYFSSLSHMAKIAIVAGGLGSAGILIYTQIPEDKGQAVTEHSEQDPGGDHITAHDPGFTPDDQKQGEILSDEPDLQNPEWAENDRINASENPNNNILPPVSLTENPNNTSQTGTRPSLIEDLNNPEGKERNDLSSTAEIPKILCEHATACVGSVQHFKTDQNIPGTWYVNGVEMSRNARDLDLNFDRAGTYRIGFRNENGDITEFNYDIGPQKAGIIASDLRNGQWLITTDMPSESYVWKVNGIELSSQAELKTSLQAGINDVLLRASSMGCPYEIRARIEVTSPGSINIPTIFTPNNDGKNDLYFVDIEGYTLFTLQIFDGNGKMVFETTDPKIGWNGKINNKGMECVEGNYRVRINYKLNGSPINTEYVKLVLTR